jgi:hypothetical protein
VFVDEELQTEVRELLRPKLTVLLLPFEDLDVSVEVIRQRSLATRQRSWVMDGHDVIAEWVKGPQNWSLADVTVFAAGRSPEDVAVDIVRHVDT